MEISGIAPDSGIVGTEVVITGSGFVPKKTENIITFDGTPAQVFETSSNQLTTKVPVGATSGPVQVEVVNIRSEKNNRKVTGPAFIVISDQSEPEELSITKITPSSGPPNTEVTIMGCGFSKDPSKNTVRFNETLAEVISVTDSTSTSENPACLDELVTVVPPGTKTGPVQVSTNGAIVTGSIFTVTNSEEEVPIIQSFSPASGPPGTKVKITGDNFSSDPADVQLAFGGVDAPILEAKDDLLMGRVPENAKDGPVTVTIDGLTVISDAYFNVKTTSDGGNGDDDNNQPPPSISGISPNSGPTGTQVTISGSNFSDTDSENSVTFNGSNATINSATTTKIIAVVPDGATTGPVKVTTNGQTAAGPDFTVKQPAPVIDAINPTSGPVSTEVTIEGENFSSTVSDNTITFNGTQAVINTANTTEITTSVPDGATTGPIEVRTNGKTATGPTFSVIPDDGDPQFPIVGSEATLTTGTHGVCLGCGFTNERNIVDESLNNFAQINIGANIAGSAFARVESNGTIPGGGDAGFVVKRQGELLGLDLLDQITLTTYRDGNKQESATGTSLLNLAVISGTGDHFFISFNTSTTFDAIEITFGGLANISSSYEVYAAYGGRRAELPVTPTISSISPERGSIGTEVIISGTHFSPSATANTVTFNGTQATVTSASATQLTTTVPEGAKTGPVEVTVNGATATGPDFTLEPVPLTGNTLTVESDIKGICLGCNTSGDNNIIDGDYDNFASVELRVGIAASGLIRVSSQSILRSGGSTGFVVARSGGLLDVQLLNGITVTTLLKGSEQEHVSGSNLLLLDLLSGSSTNRKFIGFKTGKDFDEIQIEFDGGVLSADVTFEVYTVYDDFFQTRAN